MSYTRQHLDEARDVLNQIDEKVIDNIIEILSTLKQNEGRLFVLGVGGSAANASHAVNDFRKLAGIETYAPTDNVAEITARTNDEGWETIFSSWLRVSNFNSKDCLFILSVLPLKVKNALSFLSLSLIVNSGIDDKYPCTMISLLKPSNDGINSLFTRYFLSISTDITDIFFSDYDYICTNITS